MPKYRDLVVSQLRANLRFAPTLTAQMSRRSTVPTLNCPGAQMSRRSTVPALNCRRPGETFSGRHGRDSPSGRVDGHENCAQRIHSLPTPE
jgi:hypothetical protein